jgi:hypothetical protein
MKIYKQNKDSTNLKILNSDVSIPKCLCVSLAIFITLIVICFVILFALSGQINRSVCKYNTDCKIGSNLVCLDNKCVCASSYYMNQTIDLCVEKKSNLDECSNNSECCCDQICLNNKCSCGAPGAAFDKQLAACISKV